MPYLIDGHNLIGRLPDIALDDPNDEAKLVQKLMGFAARERTRIVVVFDNGLPAGRSRMSSGPVEVVFAGFRSNADQIMIGRINRDENPKMTTVVSSDNAVLSAAQRRQMQTMKAAEFAQRLMRPATPSRHGPDEAPDLRLSPQEVAEWLRLFGQADPQQVPQVSAPTPRRPRKSRR